MSEPRGDALDPARPIPEHEKGGQPVTFDTPGSNLVMPLWCVCCLAPFEAPLTCVVKTEKVSWGATLGLLVLTALTGHAHAHVFSKIERREFKFPTCLRCARHHSHRTGWIVGVLVFVVAVIPAAALAAVIDALPRRAGFLATFGLIVLIVAVTALVAAAVGVTIDRLVVRTGERCAARRAVAVKKVGEAYRLVFANRGWGERFVELNWRDAV